MAPYLQTLKETFAGPREALKIDFFPIEIVIEMGSGDYDVTV